MSKERYFPITDRIKNSNGVLIAGAHPDDPEGLMYLATKYFLEREIPVDYFAMTNGEKGIPRDWDTMTQDRMKDIRKQEAFASAQALGVRSYHIWNYPDFELSNLSRMHVMPEIIKFLRYQEYGMIITFNRFILSPRVNHPDHNRTGEFFMEAADGLNIHHSYPDHPAPEERPHLSVFTNDYVNSTVVFEYSSHDRMIHDEHLMTYYPSQFNRRDANAIHEIFDDVTHNPLTGNHEERYIEIR